MSVVTKGTGAPILLIPGLEGRWEYLRPAIDALAASFRVVTFALCGERASGRRFEPARGFENYVAQIVEVLDSLHLQQALICGVSFGGLIAVRFAASHAGRCAGLVLVSPPQPHWRMSRRHVTYARAPRLLGPLFLMEAPLRLYREIKTAFPERAARWRFVREELGILLRAPMSLARMGARARLLPTTTVGAAFAPDCLRITAPTLVVTGEAGLDRVTPLNGDPESGEPGYACLIRGAQTAVIDRTGHLGLLTRPDRFAEIVRDFVQETAGGIERDRTGRTPTLELGARTTGAGPHAA